MGTRAWNLVAGFSVAVVLFGALLGSAVSLGILLVFLLTAAIAIPTAVRIYSPEKRDPWYALTITAALFFVSNALSIVDPAGPMSGGRLDYADILEPIAFFSAIVAVFRLGQIRDRDKDPTTIIDSLIVAGGVSAFVWVNVMLPYVNDSNLSLYERISGVISSSMTIFLVFSIARLSIGPGIRTFAMKIFAMSGAMAMVSDTFEIAEIANGHSLIQTLGIASGSLAAVCLALTALHPTMRALTIATTREIGRMTPIRLLFMTGAVLSSPAVLLTDVDANGNRLPFYIGVIGSWCLVTLLVMVRFGGLVKARERVAEMERVLSRSAASLVSATNSEEVYGISLTAIAQIIGGKARRLRVSIALASGADWVVVQSIGHEFGVASGRRLDPLFMESILPINSGSSVQLTDTLAVDNPLAGRCSTVVSPLISHARLRGALIISTAEPVPSYLVDAVGAFGSDVSLAIEAVTLAEDLHRRRSEQRFRALIENSADMIIVVRRRDQGLHLVSPAAERILGGDCKAFDDLLALVAPQDAVAFQRLVMQAEPHGNYARPLELQIRTSDGTDCWVETSATDLSNEPEIEGVVLNIRDVTERKNAELERDRSDERFRCLVKHSDDLTVVLNNGGVISYASPSSAMILGRTPDELIGADFGSFLHPEDAHVVQDLASLLVGGKGATKRVELRISTNDGESKTLDVTLTDLRHEVSVDGIVMNAHDVTDRKLLEHDLRHKVLHDDLTGIPNRVLFRERVDHALKSRQSGDGVTAALFIDIDDFKTVNDGLGHDLGDELLKVIAFRLESFVRAGDTAARLGGDEFAVLLENFHAVEDVLNASRRLLEILNQPFEFGRREITLSASVGIALAEEQTTTEVLIRNADVAMYHAKQSGKNCVKFFDQAMYLSAFERLELKGDLGRAIEREELSLNYQPLVSMESGQVVGFEALIRWCHPSRGWVSPATFIPLAEETGLIVSIGEWVLDEALRQQSRWRHDLGMNVGISINISPRQLQEDNIVEVVRSKLRLHNSEPERVTLELTESSGLDDFNSQARLIELRKLGCAIAADDFGTGFASYAALQQLPFTDVKIDRSLIAGLASGDQKAHAQVRSIVQMGHALSLSITAEGIEDARQADALTVIGANKGQGYFFGRPSSALEATQRLIDQAMGSATV